MPVFDAKSLNSTFEGQDLLAAILYPTRGEQARARVMGRRRAARADAFAELPSLEARFGVSPETLALAQNPAT